VFKTNYATALLLSGNIAGGLRALDEVRDEQCPAVGRLREAVRRWERNLTFWQRVNWWLGGEPDRPLTLDFPPGDLESGGRGPGPACVPGPLRCVPRRPACPLHPFLAGALGTRCMHENLDLILTLTGGLAAALALGYLTHRAGLSPLVGYLLAGVAVGPHT